MSKRRNRRSGQGGKRPDAGTTAKGAAADAGAPGDPIDPAAAAEAWADRAADRALRRGVAEDELGAVLTRAFRAAAGDVSDANASWGPAVLRAVAAEAPGAPAAPPDPTPATARRAADRLLKATAADRAVDEDGVAALLWQAAAVLGPDDLDVLDLHWRHGLDADEVALATGRSADEIRDVIDKLPRGYAAALRTRVLWADGSPTDPELAATLRRHGATVFDPKAVRLIHRHLQGSATARARSVLPVPAVELFAAIPMLGPPAATRAEVLVALSVGTAAAASVAADAAADDEGEPGPDGDADVPTETTADPAETPGDSAETTGDDLEDAAAVAAAIVLPGDEVEADAPEGEEAAASAEGEDAASDDEAGTEDVDTDDQKESDTPPALVPLAATTTAVAAGADAGAPGPRHEPVAGKRDAIDSGNGDGSAKRWAAIGVVAALLLVAIIAFAATRGDDDTDVAAGEDASTTTSEAPSRSTTTRPSTTTTEGTTETTGVDSSTTTAPGGVTTTTAAGGGPGPTFPIVTTTTAPPRTASIASFIGNPPTPVKSGYTMGEVTLTWSVNGSPDVVAVVGPNFQSNDASGGPTSICPGTVSAGRCVAAPGTYQYRIEVVLNGQQVPGSPRFYYLQVQPG